jgi:short-subunit dehydrogenase
MASDTARSGFIGRRLLVTGASRGIGHAIAKLSALRGDKVCLVARGAEIDSVATSGT